MGEHLNGPFNFLTPPMQLWCHSSQHRFCLFLIDFWLPSVVSHPACVCDEGFVPLMCAELTGSGKGHSLFGKDGLIVKTHEYLEVSWFDLM